jgi:AAHS family 3-hydroxyphenylpropionic acid transporter
MATGAAVAVGRLGSILGPLVAGQLLTAGFSAAGVALAMAPVVIVAGLAATAMTSRATAFAD